MGEQIRSLSVGAAVVVQNGVVVGNAQRTFRMVTLNFLAEGTSTAAGGGDASGARPADPKPGPALKADKSPLGADFLS